MAGLPAAPRVADHANLSQAVLAPDRPVGNEAVLTVERLRARVGVATHSAAGSAASMTASNSASCSDTGRSRTATVECGAVSEGRRP